MVTSAATTSAPAVYIGTQPGFRHLPAIELYNLLAPVGEHPAGSTVSRNTLEAHGWSVPQVRRAGSNKSTTRRCVRGTSA